MNTIIDYKKFNIISLDFRNVASDLLTATNDNEAGRALKKFMHYINTEPLIREFLEKNNKVSFDFENAIIIGSLNNKYDIPIEDSEEIAYIYQLLQYACDKDIRYSTLSFGYGSSMQFSVMIREFNREVVRLLVNQINKHFKKLEVEMGINEKQDSIVIHQGANGQLNISKHGNVHATQNNVSSDNELLNVVQVLLKELHEKPLLQNELQEDVIDDLTDIEEATRNGEQPKRSLLRRTIEKLKTVNELTEQGTTLSVNINRVIELLGNTIF